MYLAHVFVAKVDAADNGASSSYDDWQLGHDGAQGAICFGFGVTMFGVFHMSHLGTAIIAPSVPHMAKR